MTQKKTGQRKRGRRPSDPEKGHFTVTDEGGRRGVGPGWKRIMVFIEEEYWPELKAHASLRGVEPSNIINDLVGEFLKNNRIQVKSK
jgi:hypothetical protein